MTRLHIPGAWYCDARPDGAYVALIPGLRLDTHSGPVALPRGQNLLYVRIAPDGIRFAGAGHQDDRVWEWTGSAWNDRGAAYGVSPVIYDQRGTLLVNDGAWGSQGARYVTPDGLVVTGDASYYSALMQLSEFSSVSSGVYVGQSHPDGTHDSAWVWDAGTLRRLEPGPCRFIRAHRDGDRVSIAIWKPGDGAVIYWLTLAEIRALPVVPNLGTPVPNPGTPPTPTPEPSPMLETVRAIRAKYPTPLGARHWEFLVEVAQATGAKLFRKDGGDRIHVPALGFSVSQDIIIRAPKWIDILGDAENTAVAAWAEHDNAGEPEKWIDVSHIRLPGASEPTPDPPLPIPLPPTGPRSSLGELLDLALSDIRTELASLRRKVERLETR